MKDRSLRKSTRIKLLFVLISTFTLITLTGHAQKNEGWQIETNQRDSYSGVTLANGRIGLVANNSLFSLNDIVLNGVYDKEYIGGVSRIVRAPLFTNILLKIDNVTVDDNNIDDWKQQFNMKEAALTTSANYNNTQIEYTTYALRNLPYLALTVVNITPQHDIEVEVVNCAQFPEELKETKGYHKVLRDDMAIFPLYLTESESRTQINKLATCSAFMFDGEISEIKSINVDNQEGISFQKRLKGGQSYQFALVGAVGSSRDFFDARAEVERMTIFALQNSISFLIEGHKREWEKLWQSDIIIEGCLEDQLDVRMALYNLYAFQCKGSRLSIPPMGLSSSTGYNGHLFWDSEIWMYPPMLVLNHEIAKSHIDYRSDRLGKAMQRAAMFGYEGAMYPWESDDSGEEATPTWCLTGTFEHHITADIAIAFWNYYRVTKNLNWLKQEGYNVIKQVADFWVSRSTKNQDGSYSINNVVGANEYAPNVNDNAFTNGAAKTALQNARKAAIAVGEMPNPEWKNVADKLKFNTMADGTTLEHSSYNGEMIKQVDVNLLAYPLSIINQPEAIKRDLVYYEDKIDKVNGPAMSASILSILYSKLGDKEKAYELFRRSYMPHKRAPFGVLAETPSSNNPYFATGAGGMLQAVLFGFGGLEITETGIVKRKAMLPKQWKSLTLTGVGAKNKTIVIKK